MTERDDWLKDLQGAFEAGDKSPTAKWKAAIDWVQSQIATEPTPPPSVPAQMADLLARKVSVNTHLTYRSQAVWNQGLWKPHFQELGVRATRSKLGVNKKALQDLKDIGVRDICRIEPSGSYDRTLAQAELDFAAANADLILAVEGPNEPNNSKTVGWDVELKAYQQWLYDHAKLSLPLKDKPVVGPSIWRRLVADYETLGNMSGMMDVGNLHWYTAGMRPTDSAVGDDSGQSSTLDDAIVDARIIAGPSHPIWITETGWAIAGPGCPASSFFPTPLSQAKYVTRMLAEGHIRGVGMMSVYILFDDYYRDPPRYHGLMTKELEHRPAFDALKRTMSLFNDPGDDYGPPPLEYRATLASPIVSLPLMHKRNGTHLLGYWQDVESYNRDTYVDIDAPPLPVVIEFGSPRFVQVYQPTRGDAPVREVTASTVTVDVPDELVVVSVTV